MRRVKIDFSAGCPVTQEYAGEIGESRAVELEIIPEKEMLEDEDIVLYCCVFEVEGGVYMSAFTSAGEDILIPLDIVLTEQRVLKGQLLGQNADGTILAKSPVFRLFLGKSIEGEIIPDPETGDSIYAQLAKAILAMENKVDKIEGKGLSTEDYTAEEKAKLSGIPEPTVADYDKVLKVNADGEYELAVTADGKAVEIVDENNPVMSRFTPAEIVEMFNEGMPLTFNTHPVFLINTEDVPGNGIELYYFDAPVSIISVYGAIVNRSKGIAAFNPSQQFFTTAEKIKLAGIESGANKYILPPATDSTLGGIKVGESLTVEEDGTLNASGGELTTDELVSVCVTDFIGINGQYLGTSENTILTI